MLSLNNSRRKAYPFSVIISLIYMFNILIEKVTLLT